MPDSTCTTRYLTPGTTTGAAEYVALPSVAGVRAVTLWFYPLAQSTQNPGCWDYILDARNALADGYLGYKHYSLGGVAKGSDWSKVRMHDFSTTPPTSSTWTSGGTTLPHERWYHLYAEASGPFTGAIAVFARHTAACGGLLAAEDLHARLVSVTLWGRALTDSEVDALAGGGLGPSDASSVLKLR